MILRKRGQEGFSLIELLSVMAIIGILATIAIPVYRSQIIKAKLTEVTHSMSTVASVVGVYYYEEGVFPPNQISGAGPIKNTLGLAVPVGSKYIASATVAANRGVITFGIQGTGDPGVDGHNLVLTPTTDTQGAINWNWSGTIASTYIPKK